MRFSDFDEAKHVWEAFDVPADWLKMMTMVWDKAKPCVVAWLAVVPPGDPDFPQGSLIVYREFYVDKKTPEEVGQLIKEIEQGETISTRTAGPEVFRTGTAERLGLKLSESRSQEAHGWGRIQARLKTNTLYFMDNCTGLKSPKVANAIRHAVMHKPHPDKLPKDRRNGKRRQAECSVSKAS